MFRKQKWKSQIKIKLTKNNMRMKKRKINIIQHIQHHKKMKIKV